MVDCVDGSVLGRVGGHVGNCVCVGGHVFEHVGGCVHGHVGGRVDEYMCG